MVGYAYHTRQVLIATDVMPRKFDMCYLHDVIIMQSKSSLLFTENDTWRKKSSKTLFDVTMGSYDGAETCELVGSYLLSKLTPLIGNSIGLYREDELAASNKTPREIENIKKTICQTFSDHNLKLTISANMKRVDYLDITLDLLSENLQAI